MSLLHEVPMEERAKGAARLIEIVSAEILSYTADDYPEGWRPTTELPTKEKLAEWRATLERANALLPHFGI